MLNAQWLERRALIWVRNCNPSPGREVVRIMGNPNESPTPAEPDVKGVERQYGDFAQLYAATRARAAAQLGERSNALKWARVKDELEQRDEDRG
jgi:hypothetical protein